MGANASGLGDGKCNSNVPSGACHRHGRNVDSLAKGSGSLNGGDQLVGGSARYISTTFLSFLGFKMQNNHF